MSMVIVNDPLHSKLATAEGAVEVYGRDGKLLGHFTRTTEVKTIQLDPDISKEELDARFAAGGGRPLADILRDLRNRA